MVDAGPAPLVTSSLMLASGISSPLNTLKTSLSAFHLVAHFLMHSPFASSDKLNPNMNYI